MVEISVRQFKLDGRARYEIRVSGQLKGEFACWEDVERLMKIYQTPKPPDGLAYQTEYE